MHAGPLPGGVAPLEAYRPVAADAPVVECALAARAFADALPNAVRELEACGARLVQMARISAV